MVDRKRFWVGSTGPFVYDADAQVPDATGVVTENQAGIVCEGKLAVLESPVTDYDVLRKVDSGSVTGDVSGPGTSTDNALVRFNGADGKVLQNSGATLDDSDNLTVPGTLSVASLPAYANNAAAVAGGLSAGNFYRTGGDPDLVCVVH